MPSIADLFISVSSDVSGAITGLTDVDAKINGTTTAMQSAVPAAVALGAAAGAVGAGFLSSISVAQDFEHQINGIRSVMSPDDVITYGQAVEDLALKLGKDTVFSASQAADAIQEMIKAGVPLPAILGGAAQSSLDLASATGVDVTQAAQLASTAMNTYHVSAEALPGIMNTISNVSNATATSVGGLQFALAAVGPVAAGIGLNFQDTATALGIFANNGLQGSDAGTSLKTMLLNLVPATNAQKGAFLQLGLTTADGANQFFDASGKAKSMSDIFEILRQSTANLTDQQKINLLQTAFGTDAVRAATIAANEGAEGWNKVAVAMEAQGGTAVAAATRNAGLTGAMNQLNGTIETIQITIGQMFLPILTQLVNGLTTVLNGFLTLDPSIQVIITAVVGAAGAVAGFAAAWVLLGPVLTAIAGSFGILIPIILSVSAPLVAIGAAVALLYAAWQDDFGGIREVTQQVWAAIQPAFVNIQNFITTLANTLGPAFSNAQSQAGPFIEQLSAALAPILAQIPDLVRQAGDEFNRMGVFLGQVADVVRFLVGGDFSAFMRLLEDTSVPIEFVQALAQIHSAFDAIGPVVEMVAQAIQFLITGDLNRLYELMQEGLPQPFAAGLQLIRDIIVVQIQVWGTLLGGIKDFIGYLMAGDVQGAFNSIVETVGKIKDLILPLWNEFLLVLGNLVGALGGFIAEKAGNLWQYFLGVVSSLPGHVAEMWPGILQSLGGLMSQLPGSLATEVGDLWQYVIGLFSALPGLAQPVWETIKENLSGLMSQLPGVLATAVGNLWEYVVGLFSALPGLVQALWPDILNNLGGLMQSIAGTLATAAGDIWQYVLGTFSSLPGLVNDMWPGILNSLGGLMSQLPGTLAQAAGDIWSGLTTAFGGLIGLLTPAWQTFTEWFRGLLAGLPQFVVDNIGNVFAGVIQQAQNLAQNIVNALTGGGTTITPTGAGGGGTGGFTTEPGTGIIVPTTGSITGPIVSIGTLVIANEQEANDFLNLVAQSVLASAQRVQVPTVGTNPVLG